MGEDLSVIRQHMRFLLRWSIINCVLSSLVVARGGKQRHFHRRYFHRRYFHQYNVFWNVVTLVTYFGLRRYLLGDLYAPARMDEAKASAFVKRTRTVLAFSLGLDLGIYPYDGGLLKVLGDLNSSERLRSYGRSMWFQGVVHLTNSAVWLYRLSKTETESNETEV